MIGLCERMPAHHRFGHYYMGYLDWNTPAAIEVVSGAFCMLRREALDKVGLLDEDFFMYGEDIDLSYRVLKGGYRNYYLPSLILHYKGESTQKSSFRYVHVFYEAMLIFFRKHNSGMSLLLTVPISAAIYARASVAAFGMLLSKLRKSLGFTPVARLLPLSLLGQPADARRLSCSQYGERTRCSVRPGRCADYSRWTSVGFCSGDVAGYGQVGGQYRLRCRFLRLSAHLRSLHAAAAASVEDRHLSCRHTQDSDRP